jgi:hypothetical protein
MTLEVFCHVDGIRHNVATITNVACMYDNGHIQLTNVAQYVIAQRGITEVEDLLDHVDAHLLVVNSCEATDRVCGIQRYHHQFAGDISYEHFGLNAPDAIKLVKKTCVHSIYEENTFSKVCVRIYAIGEDNTKGKDTYVVSEVLYDLADKIINKDIYFISGTIADIKRLTLNALNKLDSCSI